MHPIVSISNLSKTYSSGHQALKNMSLDIMNGEILALLGPNGAGKTTLISIICGIVNPSTGTVKVDGYDIITEFRTTRSMIGVVPQELTLGAFDSVINTLRFSRGLFGKKPDEAYLQQLLKNLSLWDKRNSAIMTLSGGMKRRVLIGKALEEFCRVLLIDNFPGQFDPLGIPRLGPSEFSLRRVIKVRDIRYRFYIRIRFGGLVILFG